MPNDPNDPIDPVAAPVLADPPPAAPPPNSQADPPGGGSTEGSGGVVLTQLLGATGYKWVAPVISAAVIVGFFTMLAILLRTKGSDLGELKDVLFTLLGALGAAFTQVINYWMGSSKGSADKTDIMANQATTAAGS